MVPEVLDLVTPIAESVHRLYSSDYLVLKTKGALDPAGGKGSILRIWPPSSLGPIWTPPPPQMLIRPNGGSGGEVKKSL